jgi:hypothetical protein
MRTNKITYFLLLLLTMVTLSSCHDKKGGGSDEPSIPDEKYEQPVTHVYSDAENSEGVVKEVRSDGTVVIDAASVKAVPQKGEIIVSGVTDAAPEGFLYHVEGVQQSGGNIVITTSPATLNEVLPDASIEEPLAFSLTDDETNAQAAPQVYGSGGINLKKQFELLHYNANLSLSYPLSGKVSFSKFEKSEYVKVSGNVDVSLGGSFIWECKNNVPQRCGMTLNGSVGAKINMEAAVKVEPQDVDKLRWKFPYETKLKPITFFVGYVPVVIVPEVEYYVGVMSSSGKIYAKWKLLDFDALGFDARLIWSNQASTTGGHWDYGFTPKTDFGNKEWKEYLVDMLNAEVGLSGEVKIAVWPYLRYKLYNYTGTSLAIGVAGYAGLSGEIGWKYDANYFTWDDLDIMDNVSLSAGIAVPLEGKLEFNVFGKKIGGTLTHDLDILNVPLVEGATFFPVFNDFFMTPVEDANTYQDVHVRAQKGATNFTVFNSWVSDYGFAYAKVEKDANGNDNHNRNWQFVSLKSKYGTTNTAYMIETDIPTADLAGNATYEVRPYSIIKVGSMQRVCFRKGGKFKTGNAPGNGVIVDVTGIVL